LRPVRPYLPVTRPKQYRVRRSKSIRILVFFVCTQPSEVTKDLSRTNKATAITIQSTTTYTMRLTAILFSTLAATVQLEKRCRLGNRIQPCWVRWDHSECEAYIPVGVEYVIDEENMQITVHGLCESCSRALALKNERKSSDSWAISFGHVEDLGNGTFVISNMNKDGLSFHKGLRPFPQSWGTSCVYVEGDEVPED
jgi:hypothetical protein